MARKYRYPHPCPYCEAPETQRTRTYPVPIYVELGQRRLADWGYCTCGKGFLILRPLVH